MPDSCKYMDWDGLTIGPEEPPHSAEVVNTRKKKGRPKGDINTPPRADQEPLQKRNKLPGPEQVDTLIQTSPYSLIGPVSTKTPKGSSTEPASSDALAMITATATGPSRPANNQSPSSSFPLVGINIGTTSASRIIPADTLAQMEQKNAEMVEEQRRRFAEYQQHAVLLGMHTQALEIVRSIFSMESR